MNETEQWLAQYKAKIAGRQQQAAELKANGFTPATTATVRSEDSSVTVTVAASGIVNDLRFGPRASAHNPAQLAALVMRTVAEGQRKAAASLIEVVAPTEGGAAASELITEALDTEIGVEEAPVNAFDDLSDADDEAHEPAPEPPPRRPAYPTPPPSAAPAPAARPMSRPRPARAAQDDPDDFSEEDPW